MVKEIFSGNLPVVLNIPTPLAIQFGSADCPDCERLSVEVKQVAEDLHNYLEMYYVDADKVPDVAEKYQVTDLPTIILFKDGKPQDRLVGYHPKQEVLNFLSQ